MDEWGEDIAVELAIAGYGLRKLWIVASHDGEQVWI
jgi:hypothetical protein